MDAIAGHPFPEPTAGDLSAPPGQAIFKPLLPRNSYSDQILELSLTGLL